MVKHAEFNIENGGYNLRFFFDKLRYVEEKYYEMALECKKRGIFKANVKVEFGGQVKHIEDFLY